jgi:hypothetical protein
VIGCTVCTLNSSTGGALAPLVTVPGVVAPAVDAAAGTNVPIICTRLPIHGCMSAPDNR